MRKLEFVRINLQDWAIVSEDRIVKEFISIEEVISFILDLKRPELKKFLLNRESTITWDMAQVIDGRIKCVDCNCIIELNEYVASWPLDRQRCTTCKGG